MSASTEEEEERRNHEVAGQRSVRGPEDPPWWYVGSLIYTAAVPFGRHRQHSPGDARLEALRINGLDRVGEVRDDLVRIWLSVLVPVLFFNTHDRANHTALS